MGLKGICVPMEGGLRDDADRLQTDVWMNWHYAPRIETKSKFVPTVWGPAQIGRMKSGKATLPKDGYVIYLNEPNSKSQANISPEMAAGYRQWFAKEYPGVTYIDGNMLTSAINPADATMTEWEWFQEYYGLCGDHIKVIGLHYYSWTDGRLSSLQEYIYKFRKYNLPFAITEYGLWDRESYHNRRKVMIEWTTWLAEQPDIVAYFPFCSYMPTGTPWPRWGNMFNDNDTLNTTGVWYRDFKVSAPISPEPEPEPEPEPKPEPEPTPWYFTGPNNSLEPDMDYIWWIVGEEIRAKSEYEETNYHAHWLGEDHKTLTNYEYTGEMRLEDPAGGIGVTFLSDYPGSDSYYRLRRCAGQSFHFAGHPHDTKSVLEGWSDTGVFPYAGLWYKFRIRVEVKPQATYMKAKVWLAVQPEPLLWQAEVVDKVNPHKAGTYGLWGHRSGTKRWRDLKITPLNAPEAPPLDIHSVEEDLITVYVELTFTTTRPCTIRLDYAKGYRHTTFEHIHKQEHVIGFDALVGEVCPYRITCTDAGGEVLVYEDEIIT